MKLFLRELAVSTARGAGLGLALGIGFYGLMILSFWMGWLPKLACE